MPQKDQVKNRGILMKEELSVLHIFESDEVEPFQTEQSANSLFKFVCHADYIYDMLINKAIVPRYYGETMSTWVLGIKRSGILCLVSAI